MKNIMDKETQAAWNVWMSFTKIVTGTVVVTVVILGLMALFLV